jgi:PAS domain S-box-containing protein
MTPDLAGNAVVSWIGIVLQLAGSMLCLGLGLILLRSLKGQHWTSYWVWAFAAMSVAVAVLLVRYYLLPLLPIESFQKYETRLVSALYATYVGAKLGFLGCLLSGTWLFVSRKPMPRAAVGTGLGIIGVVMLIVFLVPTDLDPLMVWQAVLAIPLFLACALLLHRQPAGRRTRGSRMLATVFILLSALWLLYVPGFLRIGSDTPSFVGSFLRTLTFHNSYVDVLFEFLLGFGMILAVLDDVFLDAEEVRAVRLREVAGSEARLAQIIRAASEGILLLDATHRIVHCNPAALEILGCDEARVLGESFDRFVTTGSPEDLWSRAGDRVQRTATTPPGGHELRGRRCDGSEFPMEISLRWIGEGTPGGFVLILRDRTDRVLFEEERERARAQLAQTARLETIGRMVSGVAHELNNPLTAILAFAQDLLGQSRNPGDTEALTTIVQQSQRCRAIVLDLLTFARSKRDDREPVSPLAVVRRVLPAVERQATAREVRLEVQVSNDLPRLEASPSGMEQVLTNLVVNAIQAVRPGGRVTVKAKVADRFLLLTVEDDGPGIPPEVMPRLFEPFFTTKGPGEGTGLGLSVSHAIVEQHGGTLTAENRNPGERGARFTVRLPYMDRRSAARTTPELPRTDVLPAAPGTERARRRVLVVDDEGPIRVAIRRYLERKGWVVEEAGDGRQALELLGLDPDSRPRTDFYDAIVTDLKMPGLSGIELHDRLAAVSPESVAKLVMITGDTASPDAAEFVGRLRQPLIQKPFDMRTLADLLDRIVPAAAALPPAS